MKKVCFNQMIHLLAELHYRLNGTSLTAHSRFMFLTESAFPTSLWVSSVATPWNRITIIPGFLPFTLRASSRFSNRSRRFSQRRCAPYMEVQVSQAQEVQERPLLCTLMDAPFNLSNCGF
jgi:hypothetical protein